VTPGALVSGDICFGFSYEGDDARAWRSKKVKYSLSDAKKEAKKVSFRDIVV